MYLRVAAIVSEVPVRVRGRAIRMRLAGFPFKLYSEISATVSQLAEQRFLSFIPYLTWGYGNGVHCVRWPIEGAVGRKMGARAVVATTGGCSCHFHPE